jgi:hypothetical protein
MPKSTREAGDGLGCVFAVNVLLSASIASAAVCIADTAAQLRCASGLSGIEK